MSIASHLNNFKPTMNTFFFPKSSQMVALGLPGKNQSRCIPQSFHKTVPNSCWILLVKSSLSQHHPVIPKSSHNYPTKSG